MTDIPKRFYEFGSFRIDPDERLLWKEGQIVSLPPKVFATLLALVENAPRIVEKDVLLKAIWPDTFVEESNLSQNVFSLRKVLGEPECIENLPKRGYRFIAPVRLAGLEAVSDRPPKPKLQHAWLVAIALALVAFAGLALFLRYGRQPTQNTSAIIVLPFLNMSADPANEYFSDGLTEELIDALTRIENVRVIARTTAFQYKGKSQDIRKIGEQVGATAVVEGSVRKEGGRVRITAQLNAVGNGYHLWSQTYERDLKDVFGIQQEIAQAIGTALRGRLNAGRGASARPVGILEAHDEYLKGRYYYRQVTKSAEEKAIAYFQRALAISPDFAAAHAGMADAYALLGYNNLAPSAEAFSKAKLEAMTALRMDDSLAEAHTSLAIVKLLFDWDWSGAEQEFQRAIKLDPAFAHARHWYSHYLVAKGRMRESLEQSTLAVELDPLDLMITSHLPWHYFYAHQYQQAVSVAAKSFEIDPRHVSTHVFVLWAYEESQQFHNAIQEREILGLSPADATALRKATEASGAAGYWNQLLQRVLERAKSGNLDARALALLYAHLGNPDEALRYTEQAYKARSPWLAYIRQEPALDGLRDNPAFKDIVRRMGL